MYVISASAVDTQKQESRTADSGNTVVVAEAGLTADTWTSPERKNRFELPVLCCRNKGPAHWGGSKRLSHRRSSAARRKFIIKYFLMQEVFRTMFGNFTTSTTYDRIFPNHATIPETETDPTGPPKEPLHPSTSHLNVDARSVLQKGSPQKL